jgi:Tfp pilus assembly ATPase PilU
LDNFHTGSIENLKNVMEKGEEEGMPKWKK